MSSRVTQFSKSSSGALLLLLSSWLALFWLVDSVFMPTLAEFTFSERAARYIYCGYPALLGLLGCLLVTKDTKLVWIAAPAIALAVLGLMGEVQVQIWSLTGQPGVGHMFWKMISYITAAVIFWPLSYFSVFLPGFLAKTKLRSKGPSVRQS